MTLNDMAQQQMQANPEQLPYTDTTYPTQEVNSEEF